MYQSSKRCWRSKIAGFLSLVAIGAAHAAEVVITEEYFEDPEISWGTTGGDYALYYTDDLNNWLEEDDSFPAADEPAVTTSWTQTGLTGVTRRYYRIVRNPLPPDPGG